MNVSIKSSIPFILLAFAACDQSGIVNTSSEANPKLKATDQSGQPPAVSQSTQPNPANPNPGVSFIIEMDASMDPNSSGCQKTRALLSGFPSPMVSFQDPNNNLIFSLSLQPGIQLPDKFSLTPDQTAQLNAQKNGIRVTLCNNPDNAAANCYDLQDRNQVLWWVDGSVATLVMTPLSDPTTLALKCGQDFLQN